MQIFSPSLTSSKAFANKRLGMCQRIHNISLEIVWADFKVGREMTNNLSVEKGERDYLEKPLAVIVESLTR